MAQVNAPWTEEQVAYLNLSQRRQDRHPFTCGNRGDGKHPDDAVLVATKEGWKCPYCSYEQYYAYDFMLLAGKEEGEKTQSL